MNYNSEMHQIVLSVVILTLVVSAGCSSLTTDSDPPSTPTDVLTQQETTALNNRTANNTSASPPMPADGTDLRNVSIPDNAYSNTVYGEIDGDDSVLNGTNRYYEPVTFTAEAGDRINVTMSSILGDPELRLRAPNGSTVAIDGTDNDAHFQMLTLNQTGQYTLVAAAAEANSSFDYTLTVDRYVEPNFQGPMSEWDEQSRYLEFSRDYLIFAQNLTGGPNGPSYATTAEEADGNLTAANYTVYPEDDYVVVRYAMDPDATTYERIDIDVALQDAYWGLYEDYITSNRAVNASWVPDRIYHIGYTYDGELYRTTYLERDWAQEFYRAGNLENDTAQTIYAARYYSTLRYGPAHQNYTAGDDDSTTPSEAPVGTYENFTVEAE